MTQRLTDYFPMIQSYEEILNQINEQQKLKRIYEGWKEKEQREFLNICTGVKGMKMLYDALFKEVMNPEYSPQRLNDFLSLVLNTPVSVMKILPNDTTRLTDESSLLIMDIVVEFEDGSIANVEVQKLGYRFPGQRSACYSADLLLRQYRRLRDEKKKKFSYLDIRPLYTIVLFERSPVEFQKYPSVYHHLIEQKSNTGIEIEMPQKYVFLALDIFKKKQQNENNTIHNKLEAWMTFFCRDEPEMIIKLIEQYPDFKEMYEDVYELCRNMEGIMQIFSKELLEMDRNTVKLMIDEMQEELEKQNRQLREKDEEIAMMKQQMKELEKMLSEK